MVTAILNNSLLLQYMHAPAFANRSMLEDCNMPEDMQRLHFSLCVFVVGVLAQSYRPCRRQAGSNSISALTDPSCPLMTLAWVYSLSYIGTAGPALMPGGTEEAYKHIEDIVRKVAAQVDDGPCVTYVGNGGAGNFVKMVHNGIEYGDMQLISEAYDILKTVGGFSNEELGQAFDEWNKVCCKAAVRMQAVGALIEQLI